MAGALRKTMVYLGLAEEDDRYDGYDVDGVLDDERRHRGEESEYADDLADDEDEAPARPEAVRNARELERSEERRAAVTPISRARLVSAKPELHRITTIHPRTYNEAKTIGEAFRGGTPVIMNLTDMDDSDAKRLVDFAAGLVFGLHGSIERVTNKVFLLSPAHVEVAAVERALPKDRGLFNQS